MSFVKILINFLDLQGALRILLIVDFFLIFIDLRFFLTNESVNLLSAALLPEKKSISV